MRDALDKALAPIAWLAAASARDERWTCPGLTRRRTRPGQQYRRDDRGADRKALWRPFDARGLHHHHRSAQATAGCDVRLRRPHASGAGGPGARPPRGGRATRSSRLALFSTVWGTGLDVVSLPGNAPADVLARVIADMAALATRLRKPLSARLFRYLTRRPERISHWTTLISPVGRARRSSGTAGNDSILRGHRRMHRLNVLILGVLVALPVSLAGQASRHESAEVRVRHGSGILPPEATLSSTATSATSSASKRHRRRWRYLVRDHRIRLVKGADSQRIQRRRRNVDTPIMRSNRYSDALAECVARRTYQLMTLPSKQIGADVRGSSGNLERMVGR